MTNTDILLFLFTYQTLLLEKQQDGVNYSFSIRTVHKCNLKMSRRKETKEQVEIILNFSKLYFKIAGKRFSSLLHKT